MTEKVIQLRPDAQFVAKCPECKSTQWIIRLDAPGFEFTAIMGFECVECENIVWIKII